MLLLQPEVWRGIGRRSVWNSDEGGGIRTWLWW